MNIYNNFIHNFPKLEATKMSFNKDKQMVYPWTGILFSDKKEQAIGSYNNIDES